jgi:hypothetical protein
MRSPYTDWTAQTAWARVGFDSMMLAWNASAVIGLRMAKIAAGGADGAREAELMVSEKLIAATELQTAMLTGRLGTTPLSGTQAIVKRYGAKVRANRQRLS